MKLLRTIALDPSDTFIFDPVAEPGEWAVSGAFRFWSGDPDHLQGKVRTAFRAGFLGVTSWGWSTLVQIVDADAADRAALVDRLAQQLIERMGAPDRAAASVAAEEEVAFVQSLCEHPAGTLIAVHRSWSDGEIRESFRTLAPRGTPKPLRAFSFLDVEGEEPSGDRVDLAGLAATDAGQKPS